MKLTIQRRSPCGERGLKCVWLEKCSSDRKSLPVRGAWIEMSRSKSGRTLGASLPVRGAWIEMGRALRNGSALASLPVRGAWIEIWARRKHNADSVCRSPCGERGFKFPFSSMLVILYLSLPVRGAWIEINLNPIDCIYFISRSPCGERGLKYSYSCLVLQYFVAPRAGSVD